MFAIDYHHTQHNSLHNYWKEYNVSNGSTAPTPTEFESEYFKASSSIRVNSDAGHSDQFSDHASLHFVHNLNYTYLQRLLIVRQYYHTLLNRISLLKVRHSQLIQCRERYDRERAAACQRQQLALQRHRRKCLRIKQQEEDLEAAQNRVRESRQASKLATLMAKAKQRRLCLERAMRTRLESVIAHQRIQEAQREDLITKQHRRRHCSDENNLRSRQTKQVCEHDMYTFPFKELLHQIQQAEKKKDSLQHSLEQVQHDLRNRVINAA